MSALGKMGSAISNFGSRRGIYLGKRSTKFHVALYRWSGGRIGSRVPGWPQARIALIDHRGAKTGKKRTSPLMYKEDGEAIVVVASKAGQPTNPAWFHNLMANPETTVQIGSEVRPVRAQVATDEERARLWPQFVAMFSGYEFYERNASGRRIPVVLLLPR